MKPIKERVLLTNLKYQLTFTTKAGFNKITSMGDELAFYTNYAEFLHMSGATNISLHKIYRVEFSE